MRQPNRQVIPPNYVSFGLILLVVGMICATTVRAQVSFKVKLPDAEAFDMTVHDSGYTLFTSEDPYYPYVVVQQISHEGVPGKRIEFDPRKTKRFSEYTTRLYAGGILFYENRMMIPIHNRDSTFLVTVADGSIINAKAFILNDTDVVSSIYEFLLLPDSTVLVAGLLNDFYAFISLLSPEFEVIKTWKSGFNGLIGTDESDMRLYVEDRRIIVECSYENVPTLGSIHMIDLDTDSIIELHADYEKCNLYIPTGNSSDYMIWERTGVWGPDPEISLTRYDSSGNVLWSKSKKYTELDGTLIPWLSCELADSGLVMVSCFEGHSEFYITKWDQNGNELWTRWYNTTDGPYYGYEQCNLESFFESIKPTPDGGFVLAGRYRTHCIWGRRGGAYYGNDALFLKADSEGCIDDYPCNLSIESVNRSPSLTLFPNPVTGPQFYLSTTGSSKVKTVAIYDQTGRTVRQWISPGELGFEAPQSGLFMVIVDFEDGNRGYGKMVVH